MRDPAPLVVEAWMARKLGLPLSWDGGVTTREERRERIRAAILERGVADAVAGNAKGRGETWRGLFRRVYGEGLEKQRMRDAMRPNE